MNEDIKLLKKLDDLRAKHREMDQKIDNLDNNALNQLMLMRLKKEKLRLRDEIAVVEQEIYPDIIA